MLIADTDVPVLPRSRKCFGDIALECGFVWCYAITPDVNHEHFDRNGTRYGSNKGIPIDSENLQKSQGSGYYSLRIVYQDRARL